MAKKVQQKKSDIMSGIKRYISDCPALSKYLDTLGREVGVNYLDEPEKSYSIDQEPNEPWLKRYADGTGIKLVTFTFSSREPYGKDVIDSLCSCGFYEELCDWIEQNDRERKYPDIGDKKQVTGLSVATTQYVFDTSNTTAKYQLSLQLKYYQSL